MHRSEICSKESLLETRPECEGNDQKLLLASHQLSAKNHIMKLIVSLFMMLMLNKSRVAVSFQRTHCKN